MKLSDQVAQLEARLQAGEMSRESFEEQLSLLVRSFTGGSGSSNSNPSGVTGPTQVERAGKPGLAGGPTPHHIGAYELVELLGSGGMGAVYLAKHLLKPGLYAVKVPRYALLSQQGFGRRFKREASVGLKLDHPGIVRVHDLVIDGEWAAIVMEFVAGPNLETLIRNQGGPLPKARVLDLMGQLLDAMGFAHAQGVVHRDLKPKNLIVRPDGRLQVTDFGVAWMAEDEETQAGSMVGTAPYMAPELYTGLRAVDQRADIYAIGMTLYKLLVGRLPFPAGMTQYQVLRAKEDGMVPIPDHLPPAIADVIRTAIHPDPDIRFGDCSEFNVALAAAAGGDWDPARAPMRPPPPAHPGLWRSAAMTLLVAALVGASWLVWQTGAWENITAIAWPDDVSPPTPAAVAVETRPGTKAAQPVDAPPEADVEAEADPADPAEPSEEPTAEDRRERTADDWTVAAVSGGGLPSPRASRSDELAVHPAEPVRRPVPEIGAEPGQAPPDPEPVAAAEPPTAAPDPDRGGTVVSLAPDPLPEPEGEEAGLLYLSSRPQTRVEIDGRDYGTTEATSKGLVLQPGEYRVRFICESDDCEGFGKRSGVKTLTVTEGISTRYLADFYALNNE